MSQQLVVRDLHLRRRGRSFTGPAANETFPTSKALSDQISYAVSSSGAIKVFSPGAFAERMFDRDTFCESGLRVRKKSREDRLSSDLETVVLADAS